MNWHHYLAAFEVPLGIPVELSATEEDGCEVARVELTVRDHETGETIKVKTQRKVQQLSMLTEDEAAAVVRDLVRIALMHEIDEAITYNGKRIFNPHEVLR